jgi:hypothetical protein
VLVQIGMINKEEIFSFIKQEEKHDFFKKLISLLERRGISFLLQKYSYFCFLDAIYKYNCLSMLELLKDRIPL